MNIIISEWTKFRTLRSSWWTLGTVALLPVAVAVLVAVTGSLASNDTVLAGAIGNTVVALVPAAILGVLLAAGEHTGATMGPTIVAVPRRWPVLAAKAVVAGGSVLAVALAGNLVAFVVAASLLPDHETGEAAPLVAVAIVYAGTAVLGVAVGTALRSSAGAVTAVTGVLLLPALLGPIVGRLRWLADLGPFGAVQQVVLEPGRWLTAAGVAVACLLSVVPAGWLLLRRDV